MISFAGFGFAAPVEFSKYACGKRVSEPGVNEIVEEVFIQKFQKIGSMGGFSEEFLHRNRDLNFAICDNNASYDTRVYYGNGVVFDIHMIAYLFAQSRALIAGRYISLGNQFTIYQILVDQFVRQSDKLKFGPLEIIRQNSIELGMNDQSYEAMIADKNFQKREQTLFLISLYFLSMHERCHVGLDHGTKLTSIQTLPEMEQPQKRQELEMEADACALSIINADESQFEKSPISFFGVMMTIATQAIISYNLIGEDQGAHPATKERLAAATGIVLAFLAGAGPQTEAKYGPTIKGTSSYFEQLLNTYAAPQ